MTQPRGLTLLSLIVTLWLTGCGDSETSGVRANPEATASAPTAANQQAARTTATCVDKEGDGGPMDLLSASVSVGDDVVVRARLAGPVPQWDYSSVGVEVASADGSTFRVLAVYWRNGKARPYFSDMETGMDNLPRSALQTNGNTFTLTFPMSTVDGLGEDRTWKAFTFDGETDLDACPGPPGGMPTEPF